MVPDTSEGSKSKSNADGLRLPVLLYIPNLICYARLALSYYGLSIVAFTVARQQDDARHGTHDGGSLCSVQAMMQAATYYASQFGNTGLLPPVATTLLGKSMEYLTTTSQSDSKRCKNSDGEGAFLPNVEPDLLAALMVFLAGAALDVLDGYVARRLNQTSNLGALLDVVADNILRSCMWISSALLDARFALPCLVCLSVEWLTLLATQLLAHRDGGRHWKKQREADPRVVRYFFSNNFRNGLGILGLGGLFFAPVYPLFIRVFPVLGQGGKGWETGAAVVRGIGYMLGAGRVLSLAMEVYFVWGLVEVLVQAQEEGERENGKTGTRNGVSANSIRQPAG